MLKKISVDEHIDAIVTPQKEVPQVPMFGEDVVGRVTRFHRSMDIYKATPLVSLTNMAERLEIGGVYVKDESYRFGLNSFKVVGGVYGLANVLAKYLGLDIEKIDFEYLKDPKFRARLDEITILSATDGNHGRGLAWAGAQLGCKVVIYMPKGAVAARVNALEELGAQVTVTDLNYDDTLRVVIDRADRDDKLLHVQDQAWLGYKEIPNWISQGYMTIADEALTQLYYMGAHAPTHIFLQAGAGSMALGIAAYFVNMLPNRCPKIILIEAENANCYFASILKGEPVRILGDLQTIMAGLSVGEANTEAYRILPGILSGYLSCADSMSKYGTRLLAAPQGNDVKVISGESGSVGIGALNHIMLSNMGKPLRDQLELDGNAHVLCFSTEGDTDPESYKKIVYGDLA